MKTRAAPYLCLLAACTTDTAEVERPDARVLDARVIDTAIAEDAAQVVEDAGEDAARPRSCDERAAITNARWERIHGLDDFVSNADTVDREPASGLSGVVFGNGTWLALGDSSSTQGRLRWATSTDGVHWEARSQATSESAISAPSRVFFAHGKFVFFAQHNPFGAVPRLHMYTSTDAKVWRSRDFSEVNYVWDLASSGTDTVIAAGPTHVWHTQDLQSWTNQRLVDDTPSGSTSVAYGDGRWLAGVEVSRVENGALLGDGRLHASDDAVTWQPLAVSGLWGFSLAYGNNVWLASNADQYLLSTDGNAFEEVEPTGAWTGVSSSILFRARFAGGRFLTYVIDRQVPPRSVRVLDSLDGRAWTDAGEIAGEPLPAGATNVEYQILDAAYADCRYVIAGRYEITIPGAFDPPALRSEIGPFLFTADLASP